MTARIIRDYFAAFRWSNFKTKVANSLYMIVYFAVIFPVIMGMYEKVQYAIIYYLIAIPTIHTVNSGCLHIMKMPKQMYLVPLSQQMKREYIVKSAIFRICFCTLFGAVCTLPLVIFDMCHVITYVVIVYNILTFALIFCGMNERYNIEEREAWPQIKSDTRGIVQGIDIVITTFSLFGIAFLLCQDEGMRNVYVNLIFIIPAILFQLPLTIKHMSYWNKAVEKAMNYEISYDK